MVWTREVGGTYAKSINITWSQAGHTQVNGARKYLGAIGVASALSFQNLSSEHKSEVSWLQKALKLCIWAFLAFAPF